MLDTKKERSEYLAEILGERNLSVDNIDELLRRKPDIVVEVASPRAVGEYSERILQEGVFLVIMSAGGLLEDDLLNRLRRITKHTGARLIVPSGAIGGVDIVKALSIIRDKVDVKLITTKMPQHLKTET